MKELEKNVINDYPYIGAKECSIKYDISYNKIMWIREKFNLSILPETKSKLQKTAANKQWKTREVIHPVNEDNFIKNINKYTAYLLGFIWGDGYIYNNQIRIECLESDISNIKKYINKTGKWNYNTYLRKGKTKKVTLVSTNNKELVEFLNKMDYKNKSLVSPTKILKHIGNDLIKYFLLGYVDADGCFYFNKKNASRQFSITGAYEQDWSDIINILSKIGVKCRLRRVETIKTGYSQIRVTNKKSINIIGEFIYSDYISLERKYLKYLSTIN